MFTPSPPVPGRLHPGTTVNLPQTDKKFSRPFGDLTKFVLSLDFYMNYVYSPTYGKPLTPYLRLLVNLSIKELGSLSIITEPRREIGIFTSFHLSSLILIEGPKSKFVDDVHHVRRDSTPSVPPVRTRSSAHS